jgi:hypothetical protein
VPRAAQRLRDGDSAGRNRLLGALPTGGSGRFSSGWGCWPAGRASCGWRASECLWLRCRSGWCGRMALRGSPRRRRPCPLRFSPSRICFVGHDRGGAGATGGTTPPRSLRRAGQGGIAEAEVPLGNPEPGGWRVIRDRSFVKHSSGRPPGGPTGGTTAPQSPLIDRPLDRRCFLPTMRVLVHPE